MGDTDASESEPTQKLTPFQTMVLARFDQLDERFDKADERFDKIDERFDKIDERFDKADERFDKADERFDKIDERLDKLEAKALDTKPIWQQALAEIIEVKGELVHVGKRLDKVERGIRVLNDSILEIRADLRGHDDRITALESKPT